MNIFLYTLLFIIGTLFGSFYTLAVYRIPKNIDIVKKHSFCPNCKNKLGFFELIPVFSYIFLGGKCKHCKQKIRIRYLFLEVLSGISFMALGKIIGLDGYNLEVQAIIRYVFAVLYITAIILIAGIDQEYIKIEKRVLAYGIIVSMIYMIYLYTIDATSIYRYAIYLGIYAILLSLDTILLKKYAKDSYIINILVLLNMILIINGTRMFTATLLVTLIAITIYILIKKIKQRKNGNVEIKYNKIPIAYLTCASNIAVIFILGIIQNYII